MSIEFNYPKGSVLVPAKDINMNDRVRMDYGDLEELAESIRSNGLIHPPVVDASMNLIAGGRRTKAMKEVLQCEEIPVLFLDVLDDAHRAVLEAEENIKRKQPTWQERVLSVARVHELYKRDALVNKGLKKWTIVETGNILGVSFASVNNALQLANYIRGEDKEVCSATQVTDALRILIQRKEREVAKQQASFLLAKRDDVKIFTPKTVATVTDEEFFSPVTSVGINIIAPQIDENEMPGMATGTKPKEVIDLTSQFICGDMVEVCNSLEPEQFDHCITDIPYGIDMSNLAQANTGMTGIETVEAEHDVSSNLELFPKMMKSIYRVLKPNSFFVFFYDLDHHEKLQRLALEAGFLVQRWPLVWHKTHTCLNQMANKNFTKNYEVAMVCRKGNAVLIAPQSSSLWSGSNDETRGALGHPFVKPLKLWQWIFAATCMKGQRVLDPFAGVGSMPLASIDFGLIPYGIESNPSHYDRLIVNVANAYRKQNPNISFNGSSS